MWYHSWGQVTLAEEIEQVRHRIFLLVSLLYPEGDAMTTWDNYSSGISERQAYALEVLENIVTNEERGVALSRARRSGHQ